MARILASSIRSLRHLSAEVGVSLKTELAPSSFLRASSASNLSSRHHHTTRPAPSVYGRLRSCFAPHNQFELKLFPTLSYNTVLSRGMSTSAGKALKPKASTESRVVLAERDLVALLGEELELIRQPNVDPETSETYPPFEEAKSKFLKASGFSLSEDPEDGSVRLTKTVDDRTLVIEFPRRETDDDFDDEEQPNQQQEDAQEAEVVDQEQDQEEGHNHQPSTHVRELPFQIIVTTAGNKETCLNLAAYGAEDGSFIVTDLAMLALGANGSPVYPNVSATVPVGDLSDSLQQKLIEYLDHLGVNENLIVFMFDSVDEQRISDADTSLEKFRRFLTR